MTLAEIKQLDKTVQRLAKKRDQLLNEWAVSRCPLKPGDVVEMPGPLTLASRRARVLRVEGCKRFNGKFNWVALVRLLRKDGTNGARVVYLHQFRWEEKHGKRRPK